MTCEQIQTVRIAFSVAALIISTVALGISLRVWLKARDLLNDARKLSQAAADLQTQGDKVISMLSDNWQGK